MRQVRIAVAEMPEELSHLVEQAVVDQPDLTVVAVASGEVALILEAVRADVVVVAMPSGAVPAIAERLLDEYPRTGVVCVDTVAGRGVVYRLRPAVAALGQVSPSAIATAIRSACDTAALEER